MRMRLTLGIERALERDPDGIATIEGDRRHNWAAFAERVARLGAVLRGIGVEDGDRVAVLGQNSDRFIEAYYAIPWAGAAVVPVNYRWALPEMASSIEDCTPNVLLYDGAFADAAEALIVGTPSLRAGVAWDVARRPPGILDYEEALAASPPVPDAMREGDDLATIFYTGGTTGRPKGVMLSHANLHAHTVSMMNDRMFLSDSIYLHVAPMFHLADAGAGFGVTMAGATHVCLPQFDASAVLDAIETHGITELFMVSTMLRAVLDEPSLAARDLSSLRSLLYGASPMPEILRRRLMEALPHVGLTHRYGMTETTSYVSLLKPEWHVADGPKAGKLRSAGQPISGVEMKIVDEGDKDVATGTVGEILVRGPNVMLGYWNQPKATAAALRGGWCHSGDAGYMDEDGFVFIVDRIKDMIVSGGENVYSAEVENALAQHEGIAQCAVIGVPSERWGEAVHAVVVPNSGAVLDEAALSAHCHALIAGYKCPKSFTIRSELLPVSGAGKILKYELREPFWEGRESLAD